MYNVYTSKTLEKVYSSITLVVQGYRCSTVVLGLCIALRLVQGYTGTDMVQWYRVTGVQGYRCSTSVNGYRRSTRVHIYRSSTGVQEYYWGTVV